MKRLLIAALLAILCSPIRGDEPDYQKIADAFQTLADEFRKLAPPVNPPPPPTPQPTGPQTPILNDARIAALKKLQADNSPIWKNLKSNADSPTPLYDDNGRAAAVVYRVTGDAAYAAKAYSLLMGALNSPDIINANNVREYGVEFTLIYVWIRDALTPDQKLACETQLLKWADFALGRNQTNVNLGGFRTGDSDQTIGQYFLLAVLDAVGIGPGNFLAQTGDGPIPTPVGGLAITGDDMATARNAIGHFCTKLGKGGVWFESAEYNSNTVVLLLLGWMAMQDLHGQDYFPEIGQWAVSACDAVLTSYSPDFKARIEWGDDERPGSLDFWYQYPYLTAMQAAAARLGKTQQAGHVAAMLAGFPPVSSPTSIRGRYYYFADPSIAPVSYYDGTAPIWNYAPGVGLFSRFDGPNLLALLCPSLTECDHQNGFVADLTWYAGGEWVVHHPVTYGGVANTAVGNNAVLVSGFSSMWNKGPLDCTSTADFSYFVGNTAGKFYWPSKAGDPPSFCPELTRTIFYLPKLGKAGTIFICDRINSVDPASTVPNMWVYYANDQATIAAEAAKGPGHRHQINWHAPPGVTPTIATTTAGGAQAYAGVTCTWKTARQQTVEIANYATSGPLFTDTIDEKTLLPAADAFEAGQQIRVHFDQDRPFDCVVTCLRLDPSANEPAAISPAAGVAGFRVDGASVLFGVDQANRLIAAAGPAQGGKTYYVGCAGVSPVVIVNP